ncbi:MAG: response regulator [Hyphomonadaceae bacterium]|nr:response regulator [Hyphomonadaceae bacterium]
MSVSTTMPILIVDDYNTMIRILRNLLRRIGFVHIEEACDADAALAKLRAKRYAMVISDSDLPSMTGLEFLERVRANERTRDTPFVLLTRDEGEGVEAEQRCGASSHLVKPFTAESLRAAIERVLTPYQIAV